MSIEFVDEDRKKVLDEEVKEMIIDLENNIISREQFVSIVANKYSFFDFCYLVTTYLPTIKIEYRPSIELSREDIFISENIDEYEKPKNKINYNVKSIKNIKKTEKMALSGKKTKKRKK